MINFCLISKQFQRCDEEALYRYYELIAHLVDQPFKLLRTLLDWPNPAMHFRARKVEMLFAKKDDCSNYETLRFVAVGELDFQLVDSYYRNLRTQLANSKRVRIALELNKLKRIEIFSYYEWKWNLLSPLRNVSHLELLNICDKTSNYGERLKTQFISRLTAVRSPPILLILISLIFHIEDSQVLLPQPLPTLVLDDTCTILQPKRRLPD